MCIRDRYRHDLCNYWRRIWLCWGRRGYWAVPAPYIGCMRIARESVDPFGRYLAGGVMLLMSGQAILNLGGVLGALPLTGIPLPFISFGRSNLLVMLIAMGVVLSVARYGTVGSIAPASQKMREVQASNVTYLDSRRRHRGSRGSRPGRR